MNEDSHLKDLEFVDFYLQKCPSLWSIEKNRNYLGPEKAHLGHDRDVWLLPQAPFVNAAIAWLIQHWTSATAAIFSWIRDLKYLTFFTCSILILWRWTFTGDPSVVSALVLSMLIFRLSGSANQHRIRCRLPRLPSWLIWHCHLQTTGQLSSRQCLIGLLNCPWKFFSWSSQSLRWTRLGRWHLLDEPQSKSTNSTN